VFRIKICGIRRAEDLPHIAAAGADAVGLNFYAGSKRYLAPNEAAAITEAMPKGLARVGVFVNASSAEMLAAAERYGLDYLQLHGDEPPAQLAELRTCPIIKAFRFGGDGWTPIQLYLSECKRFGALPVAVLVDAPSIAGEYGGTGTTGDWQALVGWRKQIKLPLVLAGGLTPGNIAEAIKIVRPSAVDTASGVERADGYKSPEQVESFVATARTGLLDLYSVRIFGYRIVPNWLAEQERANDRFVRIVSGPLVGGIGTVLYEHADKIRVIVEKQHKLTPPLTIDRSISEPYTPRLIWHDQLIAAIAIIAFVAWCFSQSIMALLAIVFAFCALIIRMLLMSRWSRQIRTCPVCGRSLVGDYANCASCHWTRPMPEFS
jgi:phosphoribosylanthranilate isomerase